MGLAANLPGSVGGFRYSTRPDAVRAKYLAREVIFENEAKVSSSCFVVSV